MKPTKLFIIGAIIIAIVIAIYSIGDFTVIDLGDGCQLNSLEIDGKHIKSSEELESMYNQVIDLEDLDIVPKPDGLYIKTCTLEVSQ